MNAVDGLRDVRHCNLVGVALEDVERDAGQQSIAHGGLLREVVLRRKFRALAVPRSPLVDDELYTVIGISHGAPVVRNDSFHEASAREEVVKFAITELERISRRELRRAARGVVVDGEPPKARPLGIRVQRLEEPPGPADVVSVWTNGHESQRSVFAVARCPRGIPTKDRGILLRCEVASATPALVADSPVLHVEGLAVTVGGALRCKSVGNRSRGGI